MTTREGTSPLAAAAVRTIDRKGATVGGGACRSPDRPRRSRRCQSTKEKRPFRLRWKGRCGLFGRVFIAGFLCRGVLWYLCRGFGFSPLPGDLVAADQNAGDIGRVSGLYGSIISVKSPHQTTHASPSLVTPSGIDTCSRFTQLSKAVWPMLVTPERITT